MITPDSRYTVAAHESALCHLYTDIGLVEKDADDPKKTVVLGRDTTYLLTTDQGTAPPRRYMCKDIDNIQLLAYKTLQDPTQWWLVADANPHVRYPFDLKMGDIIHLPE